MQSRKKNIDLSQIKITSSEKSYYKRPHSRRGISFSSFTLPGVIGESFPPPIFKRPVNHTKRFARRNRRRPTFAEREFEKFLLSLNKGVLKDKFVTQHAFSRRWILDFFFKEIYLGIEIDGSSHNTAKQKLNDKMKEEDCKNFNITLLRIKNSEVFGNKEKLKQKLRNAWREAKNARKEKKQAWVKQGYKVKT